MPWDAAMVSDRAWDCFVTQAAGGQRAVSHSGRVQSGRNARNGDLTRRLHGFEEAAVVAHDDQRPFVGFERTLELVDRGEVEVVRRLVEHEQVHAAGCHERDARTRSLARRQRGGRAEHVIRTEAELREQRPRLLGRDVRARREAVHERLRAECVSPLIELADHRARTEPSFAARQRQPAEQTLEERRLAAPVRPRQRNPLARAKDQVDRAEPEGAPRYDRRIEPCDDVASARRGGQGQPQIPRLPRLVDPLERLEPPLDRARPLRERLLQPPARALAGGRRLRLPAAEGVLELAPPLVVAPVRGVLVLALQSPEALVLGEPARVLARAPRPFFELDDAIDGSVEEGAVVRDDDDAGVGLRDEPFQDVQPREVEVVGRLVEQEHVVACDDDRSECRTRGLAAREAVEPPVEADLEVDLATRRLEAPVLTLPGTADEVIADGLAARAHLLRQVADRQRVRTTHDASRIRVLQPGEGPEERRLADPVRAHDADARARRDRQRDVDEDGRGPVRPGEIRSDERGHATPEREGRETNEARSVAHRRRRSAPALYSRSRSSASALQRGSPSASSWVCGSTLRSRPHSGERPAQSGLHRILSGSARTIASRAHPERSSWSSTT